MLDYSCFLTGLGGSISKIHIFLSPCVHFPATSNKWVINNKIDFEGYKNCGEKWVYIYILFCLLDCFDLIKSRYYLTLLIVTAGGGYWSVEIRKWRPANCRKHLMWLLVQLVYVKSKISVHFLVYVSCTWRVNYHY